MSKGELLWAIIGLLWVLDLLVIRFLVRYWLGVHRAKRVQWEADHPNLKRDDWKHVTR